MYAFALTPPPPQSVCISWMVLFFIDVMKVYYITRVLLHVITRNSSFCFVLFLHSLLRFCCIKTLLKKSKFEEVLNFKL